MMAQDARNSVWHDYSGCLMGVNAGRQVGCFCVGPTMIREERGDG
jgi:hypothetical protein